MSSILDALEKSERERNQNQVPSYSTMQPPEERAGHKKVLALVGIVLLLVLLAFIAFRYVPQFPEVNLTQKTESVDTKDSNIIEFTALSLQEQAELPNLRISVTSVSPKAGRSFVMLGDTLYREGDQLAAELSLKQIAKDYVVLEYKGRKIRKGF
ncbi:MAG: general secretion pathway protein GspB [Arenicella sp.]